MHNMEAIKMANDAQSKEKDTKAETKEVKEGQETNLPLHLRNVPSPEEASKIAVANGQAPINYDAVPVMPVTDPAPVMTQADRNMVFATGSVGGDNPDWYVNGVRRADLMTDEERGLFYPDAPTKEEMIAAHPKTPVIGSGTVTGPAHEGGDALMPATSTETDTGGKE
jgi:hypothetical protein